MTVAPSDPFAPARRVGRRFINASGRAQHAGFKALRWLMSRTPPQWPDRVANSPAPKPVDCVAGDSIRATLIGHATVLLQVGGLNIVTDPIWSDTAGPVSWLGVRRRRPPAIAFDDLPRIDVILLSHTHYDHLDRPTLRMLERRDKPLVLTGLNVGAVAPCQTVIELDWWQRHALSGGIAATFVPAEHASARGPFDRNTRLWGGFVIETSAGVIYFAGDTGDGPHFAAIAERFGPITLSFLPIGAYLPRWLMAPVHMTPHEAVTAAETLKSRVTLPIHYGTFHLADDAYDEPLSLLRAALDANNGDLDFRVVEFGDAVVVE